MLRVFISANSHRHLLRSGHRWISSSPSRMSKIKELTGRWISPSPSRMGKIKEWTDRWIPSSPSRMGKIKEWTDQEKKKPYISSEAQVPDDESFTLLRFAESKNRFMRSKEYKYHKQANGGLVAFLEYDQRVDIIKCLAKFDPYGNNIKTSHKQETAKQCNCTLEAVDDALSEIAEAKEGHYEEVEEYKEQYIYEYLDEKFEDYENKIIGTSHKQEIAKQCNCTLEAFDHAFSQIAISKEMFKRSLQYRQ